MQLHGDKPCKSQQGYLPRGFPPSLSVYAAWQPKDVAALACACWQHCQTVMTDHNIGTDCSMPETFACLETLRLRCRQGMERVQPYMSD